MAWAWALQLNDAGPLIIVFLSLSAYGYIVELVQETWITNRSFDGLDIVADCVGSLVGLIVWKWWGMGKK